MQVNPLHGWTDGWMDGRRHLVPAYNCIIPHMEIEIKIRLASEDETARLEAALGTPMLAAEDQENVFFDGKHREL